MFLSPQEVLQNFELEQDAVVADFGCGKGEWSIAVAKMVKKGKVYAIDVQKDLLSLIKSEAGRSGLDNLDIVWGDIELAGRSGLGDGIVDFGIVANVLFQAGDKTALSKEVFRTVKKGGKVIVVDWETKVKKEEARKFFIQAGFIAQEEFDGGEYHYGLSFKKP